MTHTPDPEAHIPSSLFSAMLDQLQDGILLIHLGAEHPTPSYVNPALQELTGLDREQLLGSRPHCLEGLNLSPAVQTEFQQHLCQHRPYAYQTLMPHSTGPAFWADVRWTPLEGCWWMVTHRDITQTLHLQREHIMDQHHLQALMEHADAVVRVISPSGQTLYVTPSIEKVLGYSQDEFARMVFQDYIHEADLPPLLDVFHQISRGGERTQFGPFEYRVRKKDGEERWMSTVSRKVDTEMGLQFHLYSRDITLRKTMELKLEEQVRRYRTLLDLTARIESVSAPDELAVEALTFLLPLTEYTFAAFVKPEEDHVKLACCIGEDCETARLLIEKELPSLSPDGLVRRVGTFKAMFFQHHTEHLEITDLGQFSPSLAVLPLSSEGQLHGLFVLGQPASLEVSLATRRLCIAVADRVSLAYSRLLDLEKLQQAREETLRAMGVVLEYRDFETKGHTDRVVQLSQALGQRLGLDQEELEHLRLGAYLHDVGKVAIPDHVLLKPGKLTPEEWEYIKKHPGVGFEMLNHIPTLSRASLDVVLYHQERWNGTGYPAGLREQKIPLLARIFAVVDVYDALTSERPYKKAWSDEEALAQLKIEAGTLLDPEVVSAFLPLVVQEMGT
ncbi:HD domain-containing phosphohydrolase [Deinococcus cellulosilyticus]|uniref:Uncharacterized protein n=1 Tax=Deinococcus cellulosilyticus (strain DSM 18568 / NBRC 106333 / KACC 11606 / 5516J-15) TaxID=1223518 RepID=A0A511MY77_DEIC1|nr:HD domain-containing phosphohydrolase [Deinococcus cellulosilyticus]GEM45544.1 hypothetical protein DC3_11790 [Deinococcus cellulosilyticus NBRC 106333 = KACC 11606]